MPRQYYISNDLKRFYYLVSLENPNYGDGEIRIIIDAKNQEEAEEVILKKLTWQKKKFFKNI